ncbi:MAG: hypothetical protein ABW170_13960 [Candidatus Thiodiazotropha sp. L084R]
MLSNKELIQSLNRQRSRRRDDRNLFKQISIRELESLAGELRAVGDEVSAENLECQVIELLDKKICRKILQQSRKTRRGTGNLLGPLMEGTG